MESPPQALTDHLVASAMGVLHAHGVATQVAGKIVGGVIFAQPHYAHALYTEGRVPPPAAQAPGCHALLAVAAEDGSVQLLPASKEEMLEGRPHLPRDAATLAHLLSPAAAAAFRWRGPPGVVIFGVALPDDDALGRCEEAGLAISPSMIGPHAEEITTALEVFLKCHPYPAHKAHILLDWGFMVFGSDLEDAAATYDSAIASHLLGRGQAPVAPGAGAGAGTGLRAPPLAAAGGAGSASITLGMLHSAAAAGNGGGGAGGGGPLSGLAGAFGRLLSRTVSEGHSTPAAGGSVAGTPTAAVLGRRISGPFSGGPSTEGAGGEAAAAAATTMSAALAAAHEAYAAQGAAGGAPAPGPAGLVRRLSMGGLAGSASGALAPAIAAAAASASGGSLVGAKKGAGALPDDILRAPGSHTGAHDSDHYKIPSFSTGMRPW